MAKPSQVSESAKHPRQRVILLGASNVNRSLPTLIAATRACWPQQSIEILAAHGHGRSYGAWSTVIARKLPGIMQCGLWNAVRDAPAQPTFALVTDIGNDILYEHPVTMIAGWVERCFDELVALRSTSIVTQLPIKNLPQLSERRFFFFRNLFMPKCRLTLGEVTERAIELNACVVALAHARGMRVVELKQQWYGFDPIHLRPSLYRAIWPELLSAWRDDAGNGLFSRLQLHESLRLRTRMAERVRWFGREFANDQPALRFADGTTIALY